MTKRQRQNPNALHEVRFLHGLRVPMRDGVQLYEGKLGSLKRFKDDAREVQSGFECGMGVEGYNDIKVGDIIEGFVIEETPATLR